MTYVRVTPWESHQFQLGCTGRHRKRVLGVPTMLLHTPEPVYNPFYQLSVKSLVLFWAAVLVFVRAASGHHFFYLRDRNF